MLSAQTDYQFTTDVNCQKCAVMKGVEQFASEYEVKKTLKHSRSSSALHGDINAKFWYVAKAPTRHRFPADESILQDNSPLYNMRESAKMIHSRWKGPKLVEYTNQPRFQQPDLFS